MSGNAKDICVEEAKGKEKIAKADAEAAYQNTPKARENARKARADANYNVAKEKCDDLAGNAKDVCVKEAKAALVKAKADAKVDRVAADTRKDSATKQAEATQGSEHDKRDADYKVAIEKCDALAGAAKILRRQREAQFWASPEIETSLPRHSLYGRHEGLRTAAGVVFSSAVFSSGTGEERW